MNFIQSISTPSDLISVKLSNIDDRFMKVTADSQIPPEVSLRIWKNYFFEVIDFNDLLELAVTTPPSLLLDLIVSRMSVLDLTLVPWSKGMLDLANPGVIKVRQYDYINLVETQIHGFVKFVELNKVSFNSVTIDCSQCTSTLDSALYPFIPLILHTKKNSALCYELNYEDDGIVAKELDSLINMYNTDLTNIGNLKNLKEFTTCVIMLLCDETISHISNILKNQKCLEILIIKYDVLAEHGDDNPIEFCEQLDKLRNDFSHINMQFKCHEESLLESSISFLNHSLEYYDSFSDISSNFQKFGTCLDLPFLDRLGNFTNLTELILLVGLYSYRKETYSLVSNSIKVLKIAEPTSFGVTLNFNLKGLSRLETLQFDGCAIDNSTLKELPKSLKIVRLADCIFLKTFMIPEGIPILQFIDALPSESFFETGSSRTRILIDIETPYDEELNTMIDLLSEQIQEIALTESESPYRRIELVRTTQINDPKNTESFSVCYSEKEVFSQDTTFHDNKRCNFILRKEPEMEYSDLLKQLVSICSDSFNVIGSYEEQFLQQLESSRNTDSLNFSCGSFDIDSKPYVLTYP